MVDAVISTGLKGLVSDLLRWDKKEVGADGFSTLLDREQYQDYYVHTKQPLCLEDVQRRLESKEYADKASGRSTVGSLAAIGKDLQLIVDNCISYVSEFVAEDSTYVDHARVLESKYKAKLEDLGAMVRKMC